MAESLFVLLHAIKEHAQVRVENYVHLTFALDYCSSTFAALVFIMFKSFSTPCRYNFNFDASVQLPRELAFSRRTVNPLSHYEIAAL